MTRNDASDDGIDDDHITRRRLLYTSAVTGLAATAGCSGGDGGGGATTTEAEAETTSGEATTAQPTTLEAMSWGGDKEQSIVTGILDDYADSTSGIEVDYQNVPFGEYSKKLQTQFAGDEEPDVFYLIADDAPKFMRNGALLELDEYVRDDAEFDLDDVFDEMLDAFTYDGKIYGIPKDFTSVGFFQNTDHLDAAGVAEPETWSDLRPALEAIKSATDVEYPMAFKGQPRNTLVQLIWQNGGQVLNEDMSESLVGSQEAIEALELLNGLVEDDLAGLYGNDISATWAAPALGKEQTSMTMTGAWVISTLQDKYSGVYDAATVGMPIPEGGQEATIVFTTSWSASANTDSPDDAANMVKSLTSEDGMWQWVKTGSALPSRESLLERDFYDDRPLLSGLGDLGKVGRPLLFGPQTSKVLDNLMTEAEAVLTGDKAADTAMKDAQRQINNAL